MKVTAFVMAAALACAGTAHAQTTKLNPKGLFSDVNPLTGAFLPHSSALIAVSGGTSGTLVAKITP